MRTGQLAALLLLSAPVVAQPASTFDANSHVAEAIAKVRAVAMNADKVDWDKVRTDALARVAGATDSVDLLPAYFLIAKSLADHHSNMIPTNAQLDEWIARYHGRRFLPDTPPPTRPGSTFTSRRQVEVSRHELPNGNIVNVVVVPAANGRDEDHSYANAIYAGASGGPCGYVIDLRGNTGGNTFPMLVGLSALLGDGFQKNGNPDAPRRPKILHAPRERSRSRSQVREHDDFSVGCGIDVDSNYACIGSCCDPDR